MIFDLTIKFKIIGSPIFCPSIFNNKVIFSLPNFIFSFGIITIIFDLLPCFIPSIGSISISDKFISELFLSTMSLVLPSAGKSALPIFKISNSNIISS